MEVSCVCTLLGAISILSAIGKSSFSSPPPSNFQPALWLAFGLR